MTDDQMDSQQDAIDEFGDRLIAHVPPKGRMIVWILELNRLGGERLTLAKLAEEADLSEAVTGRRVIWMLALGLLAWDEDGLRVMLPGGGLPGPG